MITKAIHYDKLMELVLSDLKKHGYMDSTLTVYRRFYNRLYEYLKENGISQYMEETGKDFLRRIHVSKTTMIFYKCAVRRLDDFCNDLPYRCHHGNHKEEVPDVFTGIVNQYLSDCSDSGNKPITVDSKRKTCIMFSRYIESAGCYDFSLLNAELISKALLIYKNKDHYARVRQFLRYLYEKEIIPTDFSRIVPHYKRRMVLPTTYSPSEIDRVERSVDTKTACGIRNLAILRLASRLGLRSGDIAKLKWSEVDLNNGHICIIQEKTMQPISLQLPQDVIAALKTHFDKSISKDGFVFHSMSAPYQRITTGIIRHIVSDSLKAAGIDTSNKKHGPHALRSSLASSMVNDGVSYETVRRILGHSNLNVIKHYAITDIEKLRLCSIDPPNPSGAFMDYLPGKEVSRHV